MKHLRNIYIDSIEIAVKNSNKISYNELKKIVSIIYKEEFKDAQFENYYKLWFYSQFFNSFMYLLRNGNKHPTDIFELLKKETAYSEDKYLILSAEALFEYQEYLKLEKAKKDSTIAIGIATATFVATIIISTLQLCQSYQIASNNSKTNQTKTIITQKKASHIAKYISLDSLKIKIDSSAKLRVVK